MKPTQIASIVALSIASSAALAEQTTQLDTLVLSGGLTPISEDSYARAYAIITEEDIHQNKEATVTDILRQVPGLHVSKSGGAGGQTDIRVRGAESNHVLVLIDGIEVANSSKAFNFSHITADHIERIEVLKGAQSALYGAGATAGVINIITKSATDMGEFSSIALELVSTGGSAISADMQKRTEKGGISFGVSHRNEDGWDSSNDTNGKKDGFKNTTFNFKSDTILSEAVDVDLVARYTDRLNEYDETSPTTNLGEGCGSIDCYVYEAINFGDGYDFYTKVEPNIDVFNNQAVFSPIVTYAKSYTYTKQPAWGNPSYTKASTVGAQPQIAFSIDDEQQHNLVIAAEYQKESYQGSTATGGDVVYRKSTGIAIDYNSHMNDNLFVQAGMRYDNNDKFDNATAWAVSTSYKLGQTSTLRASAGQSQTNPTFTQLFGWGANFTGNPNLKPEQNTSWDIGIDHQYDSNDATVSITYFDESLKNAITSMGQSASNAIGNTKKSGVEVSVTFDLTEKLNIAAGYTYLDGEDPDGDALVRRPMHAANMDVTYNLEKVQINMDINYYGSSKQKDWSDTNAGAPNYDAPMVDQPAYTLVDLNIAYDLNEATELYASVKNLTNKEHQEILGFQGQPRTIYAGIKHSW